MKKRSFLNVLLGNTEAEISKETYSSNVSLEPYSGPWNFQLAAHLLRRTTFGPSKADIDLAVSQGLTVSIDQLLIPKEEIDPPIYYKYESDPNVPLGETWIDAVIPSPAPNGLVSRRRRSLYAWMVGQMNDTNFSIHEKMWLFWHNHFAVSDLKSGNVGYQYLEILRKHALGDFKQMLDEITISPAMLIFLNGNDNKVQAPNENYARELLELFTIGAGPVAGDGDYTNYTEQDVVEMARCLTGWRVNVDYLEVGGEYSNFFSNQHDTGDKQLSHRFENVIISNEDEQEYKKVLEVILSKKEVAKYLCRQLHIWFVGNDINPEVESEIIEPLADIYFDSGYDTKVVLQKLLASEYFHDKGHRGCMISHPLDYIFKVVNAFDSLPEGTLIERYYYWNKIVDFTDSQGMAIMQLPTVAGWKAFYQEPQYDELWINSNTLSSREQFIDGMVNGFGVNGSRVQINTLEVIAGFSNAGDPNSLIEELTNTLFCNPISQMQADFLKGILIPGLPDYEWTIEYNNYLDDPDNNQIRNSVEAKLKALFNSVLKMPEYYLI